MVFLFRTPGSTRLQKSANEVNAPPARRASMIWATAPAPTLRTAESPYRILPSFRGAHAVEEALEAGVKVTGCTVHVATLEVDAGPILAQEAVPVLDDDTVESLHERIKSVERRLYPDTIKRLAS